MGFIEKWVKIRVKKSVIYPLLLLWFKLKTQWNIDFAKWVCIKCWSICLLDTLSTKGDGEWGAKRFIAVKGKKVSPTTVLHATCETWDITWHVCFWVKPLKPAKALPSKEEKIQNDMRRAGIFKKQEKEKVWSILYTL